MLQYLGCGHSTQIPEYGIITQVFLPNPCSDIGLWAQYPNPCIWGNYYSSIPTKSLTWYWAVGTVPKSQYMGELLLKYPYQIPDLVLGCGHSTQIPVYGGIISQVSLPNPWPDIGLWAQYPNPCIWGNITKVSLPNPCSNIGLWHCGRNSAIGYSAHIWVQYPHPCIWGSNSSLPTKVFLFKYWAL